MLDYKEKKRLQMQDLRDLSDFSYSVKVSRF